jgi:hypothetical protein
MTECADGTPEETPHDQDDDPGPAASRRDRRTDTLNDSRAQGVRGGTNPNDAVGSKELGHIGPQANGSQRTTTAEAVNPCETG